MSSEFPPEFVARLRAYERKAWLEAFDSLHVLALRGVSSTLTFLSPQDREESASEALAELARQISDFTTWSEITAWTFVTARRRAIDRLRRLRAQKRYAALPTVEFAPEHIPEAPQSNPQTLSAWSDLSSIIGRMVAELGEPAASLVRGYTQEGQTYSQLAARYQLPLGTVTATVYRSMRKLERELMHSSKLARELLLYLRDPSPHEQPTLPTTAAKDRG